MRHLIDCRLLGEGCSRRLYLFPLVLGVLALASPVDAVACPRIQLPGYDCECLEHVESWIANCVEEPGRVTQSSAGISTSPSGASERISATATSSTTTTTTTEAATSNGTYGARGDGVTDSNVYSDDGSHNDLADQDRGAKVPRRQSVSAHGNDAENRVKTIGDPHGHTKREERIVQSKLDETNSQAEHLVKMQVRGVRSRRAQPPPTGLHFEITNPSKLHPAFSIQYYPGIAAGELRKLVITCDTSTMEIPDLVDLLGVKVNIFAFDNCPVPQNTTFMEMLNGNKAKLLQLEIKRPKLSSPILSKAPFEGLPDSIKDLVIIYSNEMGTRLAQFEDGFFANFTMLESLTLRNNGISDLRPLRFLRSLKELSLVGNPLAELNASTFANLDNLEWLQLSSCDISGINPDTFGPLTKLKQLNLAKNKFSSLPSRAFAKCRSLTELCVDFNNLVDGLPEDVFDGLANSLNEFSCKSCHLQSLPAKIFDKTPNMKSLQLSNNRIRRLDDNTFRALQNLVELTMPNNDLETLSNRTFEKLEELETLNLLENDLISLPDGVFDHNTRLKEIDLTGNSLSRLPNVFLQQLVNLQTLKLDSNHLTSIPESLTGSLRALVRLSLSNNSLTKVPLLFLTALRKLEALDLSRNAIRNLTMIPFLSTKIEIDLRGNPIERVTGFNREKLRRDQMSDYVTLSRGADRRYLLDTTSLRCDCHLVEFHNYLQNDNKQDLGYFDKYYMFCSTGKEIARMKTTEFTCAVSVEEGCPSKSCKCFVEPSNNGYERLIVNCTMAGLESLTGLPSNVTDLELQYNNLTEVPDLGNYTHLKKVNLSNNHISDISGFLGSAPSVEAVSFRNNLITKIDPGVIKDLQILYDLELSGNPMTCNCDTVPPIAEFITSNSPQMPDNQDIVCSKSFHASDNPAETRLMKYRQEYCPANLRAQLRKTNIYVGTTIAIAALLIVVIVVYYKNKTRVRIFLFVHFYDIYVVIFGGEQDGKDKIYDAFISYSDHDSDVMEAMLAELEHVDPDTGEQEFKLCVHGRDFEPCLPVVYNILNSVQNSRRTILVLSDKFVESTYFNVELSTALSEMSTATGHKLIIVLKGEMPPMEKMDKDLQKMVKNYTYIKWGSRWFWDSLRYAMPHKRPRRPKRSGNNSKDTRNELDHAMRVLNKYPKPTAAEVARKQEQLENERNRQRTAAALSSTTNGPAVPSIFGRSDKIQDSAQGKILTGQVNGAFEPLSMEEIRIQCDSINGDSFRSKNSSGETHTAANGPQQEQPDAFRPMSARHRPNGVARPPRRKDKDSTEA